VDNELEVIRHQMEEKRASLADKLDALEGRVIETVQGATAEVSHVVAEVKTTVDSVTEGVKETVESVTTGVQETVESVKESLDFRDTIRRHPWTAVGGAFAVGCLGAYLLGHSSRRTAPQGTARPQTYSPPPEPVRAPPPETQAEPSALVEVGKTALTGLKGLAVGTLMGVLREVAVNALPDSLKNEVSGLLNEMTTKLGGKTLGDLGLTQSGTEQNTKGETHGNGNEAKMGRPLGSAQREDQEPVGQSDRRRVDAGRRGLRANDRAAQRANGKEP
jgi:ElaB/YqjD/DUF883 family membrane-anchored ribosome-binding protein